MSHLADLLTDHVNLALAERCLVFSFGQGTTVWPLTENYPNVCIDVIDPHFPTQRKFQESQPQRKYPNLSVVTPTGIFPDIPTTPLPYDRVIILIPKGRSLARRWLVQAAAVLSPGGYLSLAGPKDMGIESIAHDAAEIFGEKGSVLGYKKGQRVIGFTRAAMLPAAPAWAAAAGVAPGTWSEILMETPLGAMQLSTLPGVFAFSSLDEGTRLLLEKLEVRDGETVLDIGCGIGVIGIAASLSGAGRVEMVDTNLLAVAAARRNIAAMGLHNAEAYPSDALSETEGRTYNLISSNPPFHSGKGVDYRSAEDFICQGRRALAPGAE